MNQNYPVEFKKDQLRIQVLESPYVLATFAAKYVEEKLQKVISKKGSARIIIATGSSQFSFYEELIHCEIDWKKIAVFHLDEYLGLSENSLKRSAKFHVDVEFEPQHSGRLP